MPGFQALKTAWIVFFGASAVPAAASSPVGDTWTATPPRAAPAAHVQAHRANRLLPLFMFIAPF